VERDSGLGASLQQSWNDTNSSLFLAEEESASFSQNVSRRKSQPFYRQKITRKPCSTNDEEAAGGVEPAVAASKSKPETPKSQIATLKGQPVVKPQQGSPSMPQQGVASNCQQGVSSNCQQGVASNCQQGVSSNSHQGVSSNCQQGVSSNCQQGVASNCQQGVSSNFQQAEPKRQQKSRALPQQEFCLPPPSDTLVRHGDIFDKIFHCRKFVPLVITLKPEVFVKNELCVFNSF
jgi:hypothetical protein